MVHATTIDSVLSYLAAWPGYSIWASALAILRSQVEASVVERVLFAASDNEACVLQGFPSGGIWAISDPTSFLCQIIALPPHWPASPVRMYESDTLGVDANTGATISLYMRVSPKSFILPSSDSIATCDLAVMRPNGCALTLRTSFLSLLQLTTATLQSAIDALSPELTYFSTWLNTAGLGGLPLQPGTFTLLAPTNQAFERLALSIGTTACAFVTNPAYAHMANYHVASGTLGPLATVSAPPAGAVASDGFLLTFQTSAAASFAALWAPPCYANYVNCATIYDSASQVVGNGILYVIDSVLSHGISGPPAGC